MATYRGTTPTLVLKLPNDIDLTDATDIVVTFSTSGGVPILEKKNEELTINVNEVSVFLTQAETLKLPTGNVSVQLNWTYMSGGTMLRACTEEATIDTRRNLKNEVM